jgi:hypothetical protein
MAEAERAMSIMAFKLEAESSPAEDGMSAALLPFPCTATAPPPLLRSTGVLYDLPIAAAPPPLLLAPDLSPLDAPPPVHLLLTTTPSRGPVKWREVRLAS